MSAVCPITHQTPYQVWPCVLAAGHDGDCRLPIEAEHYTRSLDTRDADWLRSEVRVLLTRIERLERDRREDPTPGRHARLIRRLINLAPANGKRKNVPAADVQAAWMEAVNG